MLSVEVLFKNVISDAQALIDKHDEPKRVQCWCARKIRISWIHSNFSVRQIHKTESAVHLHNVHMWRKENSVACLLAKGSSPPCERLMRAKFRFCPIHPLPNCPGLHGGRIYCLPNNSINSRHFSCSTCFHDATNGGSYVHVKAHFACFRHFYLSSNKLSVLSWRMVARFKYGPHVLIVYLGLVWIVSGMKQSAVCVNFTLSRSGTSSLLIKSRHEWIERLPRAQSRPTLTLWCYCLFSRQSI